MGAITLYERFFPGAGAALVAGGGLPTVERVSDAFAGAGFRVEGLRAVAVTAVVAYHAGATWLPGGFLGVDVFFVVSGYLIAAGLLQGRLALHHPRARAVAQGLHVLG